MISLLAGDDDYQIELEIESLLGAARRRGAPFYEAEFDPEDLDRVFGHLSSPSLFATDPPIALLRDADAALAKEPTERIAAWERGSPQGLLVLVAPGAGKGERASNALVKTCEKNGRLRVVSRPQRPGDWIRWIRARAQRFGFAIDEAAAKYLHETVGESAGPLDRELEKISLLGEKRIDRAALAELVDGSGGEANGEQQRHKDRSGPFGRGRLPAWNRGIQDAKLLSLLALLHALGDLRFLVSL